MERLTIVPVKILDPIKFTLSYKDGTTSSNTSAVLYTNILIMDEYPFLW